MRQRGFVEIIVIIVVLVLAAIGGAYYLGTQKNNVVPSVSPAAIASPTTSDASQLPNDNLETANPDSIGANWKTYTNTKVGYTFRYPASWQVLTSDPEDKRMFNGCDLYIQNNEAKSTIIALDVLEGSDGAFCWSYGRFYDDQRRKSTITSSSQEISVSKWSEIGKEYEGDLFQDHMVGKNTIAGLVYKEGKDQNAERTFDQILSTFKFTP